MIPSAYAAQLRQHVDDTVSALSRDQDRKDKAELIRLGWTPQEAEYGLLVANLVAAYRDLSSPREGVASLHEEDMGRLFELLLKAKTKAPDHA